MIDGDSYVREPPMPADPPDPVTSERPAETTAVLLVRIRSGDPTAANRLFARYLPLLRRVAHGRVPRSMRGQIDTDDLVQASFQRALRHLHRFEARREGAFLAYLRRILLNQVRDAARRGARQPVAGTVPSDVPCAHPTPLEEHIRKESLEAYEAALAELSPRRHRAVILRLEFGMGYAAIAEALDLPSPVAARLVVSRAIRRLGERIRERSVTA